MTRPETASYVELGSLSHTPYRIRLERYELIFSMRHGLRPYDRKHSLQQIADELARTGHRRIGRERVRQLLDQGPPAKRE